MSVREEDVYITRQLAARPIGKSNHLQEKQAIQELAQYMADDPSAILPRFTQLAMEITGARAGGLSMLEKDPPPGRFRWRYVSGAAAPFENALAPRNYSPCGVTLDRNAPVLTAYPGRYYSWIGDAGMDAAEVLLVPLNLADGEHVGTLWAISDAPGHFHRGHVRALTELSRFVAVALRMAVAAETLHRLQDKA